MSGQPVSNGGWLGNKPAVFRVQYRQLCTLNALQSSEIN